MNARNAGGRNDSSTCPAPAGQPVQGTHVAPFSQRATVKVEKLCRLCRKDRQGAAVVEFAVVAPVLVLLVFGMVEFGRMVMVQQVLTNAAREGARVGVLDDSTVADVQTTVNNYLAGGGVKGATVTVSPNPLSSAGYGAPVTVTVSVPFSQVSWLPSPMFLKTTTMSASTAMRRESVQ
jgi:Flp pilus assembly protein TadG